MPVVKKCDGFPSADEQACMGLLLFAMVSERISSADSLMMTVIANRDRYRSSMESIGG